MDPKLIAGLVERLGAQTRVEGSTLRAIVQHGDAWLATRVRVEPVAEVFVATRPLDGFELGVRWGDRWRDPNVGDPVFDKLFALETNDETMMRAWLDDVSRKALLDSVYTFTSDEFSVVTLLPITAQRTWSYTLANDELVAAKGTAEHSVAPFLTAIMTACAIAGRSQRWAASYAEIARAIGGSAASEVEIGGVPVISATRSAIDVTMRLVRRADTEDRLRTIVSAPRIGEGRLALWNEDLRKAARPAFPDGKRFPLELDGHWLRASDERTAKKLDDATKKLVVAARPAVIVIDASSVDVWFDGALADVTRIDTAVALAAHLAVDAIAPQGPYR